MNERKIDWPSEITFKSIFRNKSYIMESIKSILMENNIKGDVYHKESKNGKFISYTITGTFLSDSELQLICHKISTIEGFMTMF